MLSRFRNYIEHHDLIGPQDRVLLAVSGGLDSMVMLHLFQLTGYAVGVAHGNFGLREKESDGDEAFVNDYCVKHSIPCYVKRFDTKNYAETRKISVQMAARELRYVWFNELAEEKKFHWVATAHHLNDSLETVLMRLSNGSGLDQLTGIPKKNERIVRPLLFASREEIHAFAKESKISWREDASNVSTYYQRNFIRHQVIPKLKEINPSLERTFADTLEKLEGAAELMHRGLGQLRDTMTRTEGRDFFIDKNLLLLLQNPAYVCYEWLRPFGFDLDLCRQLVSALTSQSGSQVLSATHTAIIDRDSIIVSPKESDYHDVLVEEGQDKAALGMWVLKIWTENKKTISQDPLCATVDLARVRFPLVWRRWKPGDSFVPLGMSKSKKVSDFLIDERVSVTDKNRVTIITSADEIVWIAGYRVDDRFKVSSKTRSVLVLQLTQGREKPHLFSLGPMAIGSQPK